jgi:hypothetical protein
MNVLAAALALENVPFLQFLKVLVIMKLMLMPVLIAELVQLHVLQVLLKLNIFNKKTVALVN